MKKLLLMCFSFVFVSVSLMAQDRVITGKVSSIDDGSSLPGVNVVLKGTTNGAVTDADGNYKISVPSSGGTLLFSFIGLKTAEETIGERSVVDISLASDISQLEEVVVTAQGVQQAKRALGYSVTTVAASQIENRPGGDISRILQGKIPGVNITSTSGVSGTGTNIIIRGYSSISGSNQPLFVVDGVPFNSSTNSQTSFGAGGLTTSSRMLDLDPNSIESVSVLKGLAATVLYGDQGRRGVILITTKAGGKVAKKPQINFTQGFFKNSIASLPDYQNNYGGGFQQLTPIAWFFSNWGANFNDVPMVKNPIGVSSVANIRNAFPEFAVDPSQPWGPTNAATVANVKDYPNKAYPNIGESFFRKGNVYSSSLQIGGSAGSTGYSASVGYQKEEGFTPFNDIAKLNLGLGLNTSVTDKISIKSAFQFANTDVTTPPLNPGFGSNANGGVPSIFANVMYTPRNVDLGGLPYENPIDRSSVYYRGGNDITNPRWAAKNYANTSVVNRFFNSTSLNYDINENFSVAYRIGLDTYNEKQEVKLNKGGGAGQTLNVQNGVYTSISITNTILNHDLMLNYKTKINDNIGLSALLGTNNRYDKYQQFGLSSTGQVAFGLFNHGNFSSTSSRNILQSTERLDYLEEQRRIGVYANVTLDYSDFLYVNLMGRNDWTSTVEKDNRQIFYPGASVSFIPTSVFDLPSVIEMLKLRVGYGTSAGFPDPYGTRNILSQNTRAFSDAGNAITIGQTISNRLGNPNLRPETVKEIEFGLEGTMLKGRLGFDLSLYQRNTDGLITDTPLDPSTGFTETRQNIGSLETKGIDLILRGTPIKTNFGLSWDATINFGRYKSVVTELVEGLTEVNFSGFSNLGNFAIPGKPYGTIKGIGIERNANGEKIVLSSGRYKETAGIVELGDPNPAFTSSLVNTVNYKDFSLSFMIEYRHKGVIVSNTVKGVLARGLSTDTDQLDRALTLILPGVQADGTKNTVQVTAANYFFDNYFFTDEAITFDGSTLRLREASFSYRLPKTILGNSPLKAVSVSLTASNIWFRALNMPKGVNFDTDVLSTGVGNGLGFDYLTGPSARRIGGTISLTF